MTKKEYLDQLQADLEDKGVKMTLKDLDVIISTSHETIMDGVKAHGKVQFVGFGTFESRERAAREGRNPRSKEIIHIPATIAPAFKAGKEFKTRVK